MDSGATGSSVAPGSVHFSDISKLFGETRAVDRLDLEIADGELLVVVGPSGCGKTTALRMVAGLEEPTSGRIVIGGRDVTNIRGRDRDLAMVFQSYALYPHLSVEDNIAFGLRQRKTPSDEIGRRVANVARMLELDALLTRKPGQLSGGQRQRVALGRAIARQTDVLLMDEPLSNLDAQLRQRARVELSELHRRLGTTILYVTHDQVEAMTMGHRVAVMKDGVLQQCDTPQQVYDRPANRFVAGFIGSPPMNLIPARIVSGPMNMVGGDTGALTITAGSMSAPVNRLDAHLLRAGSDVVMGIRPEHFDSVPTSFGTGGLDGVVRVVEPLGSDQFVTIEIGEGERVTARLRPNISIRIGDQIGLTSSLGGVHVFDPSDGNRIVSFAA